MGAPSLTGPSEAWARRAPVHQCAVRRRRSQKPTPTYAGVAPAPDPEPRSPGLPARGQRLLLAASARACSRVASGTACCQAS
jgi:hypothetical protein